MTAQQHARVLECLAPFRPVVIYLFGSQAEGRGRPESDVDLAFLPPDDCSPGALEVFTMAQRLAEIVNRDVDLVDLAAASTVMRKEVVRTGRILLESDRTARQEFEMYTLSDYARLNTERRPVLEALGYAAK